MDECIVTTRKGYEVHPTPRAKLPGYYINRLCAERALEKYLAEARAAKSGRKKG